jgi:hypothetical protein
MELPGAGFECPDRDARLWKPRSPLHLHTLTPLSTSSSTPHHLTMSSDYEFSDYEYEDDEESMDVEGGM